MTTNLNQESGISGATAQSLSVPQLVSTFSYTTEGGYIKVYLAKAGFSKLAVMTFDDTHDEFAYAVQTLVSRPALVTKPVVSPVKAVYEILENAEKEFYDPFIPNPFSRLLHDNEATTELVILFRKFLEVSDV
jgi:hypothetical protein